MTSVIFNGKKEDIGKIVPVKIKLKVIEVHYLEKLVLIILIKR